MARMRMYLLLPKLAMIRSQPTASGLGLVDSIRDSYLSVVFWTSGGEPLNVLCSLESFSLWDLTTAIANPPGRRYVSIGCLSFYVRVNPAEIESLMDKNLLENHCGCGPTCMLSRAGRYLWRTDHVDISREMNMAVMRFRYFTGGQDRSILY